MIKDYLVQKHSNLRSNYGGGIYPIKDWKEFCWDGSEVYVPKYSPSKPNDSICSISTPCYGGDNIPEWMFNIKVKAGIGKKKAPQVEVKSNSRYQYLEVPYRWQEFPSTCGVVPHNSMQVGNSFRGKSIKSQTAIKKDNGFWYWRLEF